MHGNVKNIDKHFHMSWNYSQIRNCGNVRSFPICEENGLIALPTEPKTHHYQHIGHENTL